MCYGEGMKVEEFVVEIIILLSIRYNEILGQEDGSGYGEDIWKVRFI